MIVVLTDPSNYSHDKSVVSSGELGGGRYRLLAVRSATGMYNTVWGI